MVSGCPAGEARLEAAGGAQLHRRPLAAAVPPLLCRHGERYYLMMSTGWMNGSMLRASPSHADM